MRNILAMIAAGIAIVVPTVARANQYNYTMSVPLNVPTLPSGTAMTLTCTLTGPNGAASTSQVTLHAPQTHSVSLKFSSSQPLTNYGCAIAVSPTSGPNLGVGLNFLNGRPAPGWSGNFIASGSIPKPNMIPIVRAPIHP